MPDLLANLNPEQLAAVTLPNEPALILAGAGSGKTRVLITRIAWLIQQGYASPPTVLAVTFTNKAAREMMSRLSALLPIDTRGMWIGTFHGLCNRMLRAHYRDAGLPQTFQILDTVDQLSAIKRLMKGLNVDDEKYPAKNLQYFINNAKEQGLRPKDVDATDVNRKFIELYAAYDQQCQREGVVDFPELLLRCFELLAHNVPLRAYYQARFRQILVDEFQDTNKLQYAWLKMLAGEHNAIFAVGDDDQSIYAFRGANVGNMRDFEHEFRVRNLIKLEQNYRSHRHILDAANHLIANNARRLGKNLRTDAGHGESVRVYEAATDSQEAGWIVEEIKALLNTGATRGEVAVLYRSNAQSRTIEHTLVNAGIPYRVYGGLRFFERQEVKHALAYLRLIDNPNDDTAFARVVNFPTRGIGARSIEQLADAVRLYNCSMAAAVPYVTGKAGTSLGTFATLIAKMRAETQQMSLPETVEYVVRASGLAAFYETEREGQDRLENLQELVNAAAAFVSEEGCGLDTPARSIPLRPGATNAPEIVAVSEDGEIKVLDAPGIADPAQNPDTMTPLAGFLSHASLEAGDNQAQAGQDAVQLMTVHAAKGLEFTAVFITGLEEGLFPHENSAQESDGLEEERRLMYVAITRAKERLYISFAQSRMLHGQTHYNVRSRFFDELPEGALKWLTPKLEPGARWGGGRVDDAGWGRDWFARPGQERGGAAYGGGSAPERLLSFANEQRAADAGFKVGQAVFHTKFGEGTVTALEGSGSDARAQVRFKRHGEKWLALAVAKLQAVE